MIKLAELTDALVDTLQRIAPLVAVLAPEEPIKGYTDVFPTVSAVEKALDQIQPGQVVVMWVETTVETDTMSRWAHRVELCVKPLRDQRLFDVIDLIVQGVPVPGDGMCWRMCPVMAGVLPTNVINIVRRTDAEGVDYGVILTETLETGDWFAPPTAAALYIAPQTLGG